MVTPPRARNVWLLRLSYQAYLPVIQAQGCQVAEGCPPEELTEAAGEGPERPFAGTLPLGGRDADKLPSPEADSDLQGAL